MLRLARIDYAVAAIEIVDKDAPTLPTPGHAPARLTDEGYLLADALLARDGVLEYGDGKETWYEYRPRAELEAAAASWACKPITDKHPSRMVDAKTWAKVARGVHVSVPEVVDVQGVAYMSAKVLITDADLIAKVTKLADQGKPAQLSIGFTSVVIEREGEYAGTPFRFVQTELVGNHTAVVDEGRAGPICRVLLDGANAVVSADGVVWTEPAGDPCYTHEDVAEKALTPNTKPGSAKPNAKTDEAGAPDELVSVPSPSGEPVQLPSWAAEMIAKARAMGMPAPAPAAPPSPMAPAPAPAPMANAMQSQPPAPAAPQPAPEKPEDRKESTAELIVARRKLERVAEKIGVDAKHLDEVDDDLKRAVIAKRWPHVKCDKLDGAALDAFVTAIADEPASTKPAKAPSPWRLDEPADKSDKAKPKTDSTNKALAEYLASQGYGS